jgi:6,7-dimethyl-8-ribityllumazine synthase
MIKRITTIRPTASMQEFEVLCELFRRLGFEEGKSWGSEHPGLGTGTPFGTPIGELEFVHGIEPAAPKILIECNDLESVYKTVRQILHERGDTNVRVSPIQRTHWKSHLFGLTFGLPRKEMNVGFWEFDDPLKNMTAAIEGDLNASGMRFGIVVSRWNQVITERLLHGAIDALRRSGAKHDDLTLARVPGAFELPTGARTLAETGKVDAVIALGCLIRGETTHYEHIATEATRGIGQSAQETGIPHAYGLLTCENLEQALDRAGLKSGNKGFEAAMSAIEMVSLQRKLRSGSDAPR